MADQPNTNIFNKRATEKLRNPDDLDKYVRITHPSVWMVLGACAILIVGLLIWGVFGAVTTSVSGMGVVVNGEAVCYLGAEDATKVDEGDAAVVDGVQMKVAAVSAVPMSREEVGRELQSDYLLSALMSSDWAYKVVFEGDTSDMTQGVPVDTSITVERIAPISLILRS